LAYSFVSGFAAWLNLDWKELGKSHWM